MDWQAYFDYPNVMQITVPWSILVYSGQHHIISNASIVDNCIIFLQVELGGGTNHNQVYVFDNEANCFSTTVNNITSEKEYRYIWLVSPDISFSSKSKGILNN